MNGLVRSIVMCAALSCVPSLARAQAPGQPYASGGFSGFRLSSDDLDGSATGYDVGGGAGVLPWLAVEGSIFNPGRITETRTGRTLSFAGPGATREEIERLAITERLRYERNGTTSFAVAAVFHAPQH